ncbi:hypothetical protein HBI81_100310 [Parastagonospora nodorum]|nr:hypothetical protein HBH52_133580 [Parastagonospora nodorum]KAH5540443.1 hypothetical protein HBI27_102270 [Parastagonospora nodorum]KAH6033038.1 hypothetical protein HBI83_015340 [Parastagonospora nodorum]KAH6220404.1 hypothetical protein HBI43_105230 [Parastagonospora nodorum]KAH6257952.1 hypothetical protein HBI42_104070 [Parastagonospora nodorum]
MALLKVFLARTMISGIWIAQGVLPIMQDITPSQRFHDSLARNRTQCYQIKNYVRLNTYS